jgi:hypothetical protein
MKNRVEIEGYVTNRIWQWSEPGRNSPDTLFRLACYPDLNGGPARSRPFYVTVRIPGSVLNGVPVGVMPGQRLMVTGRLVSRDYTHSLGDFLARVKDKPELILPDGFDPERVVELRSLNEVIVESIRVAEEQDAGDDGRTYGSPVENNSRKLSRRERRRERRQVAEVPAYTDTMAASESVTHSPDSSTLPAITSSNAVFATA